MSTRRGRALKFLALKRGRRTYTAICTRCMHHAHEHASTDGFTFPCERCGCLWQPMDYVWLSALESLQLDAILGRTGGRRG